MARRELIPYRQATMDEICRRMSEGEVLSQILREEGMPSRTVIVRWLQENPEAERQYLQARERLLDLWADEVIEIAEDGRNDWVERENARGQVAVVLDKEAIARSRLRIESRQWLLAKLRPETYGDSQRIDLRGRIDMSEKEVEAEIVALLLKGGKGQRRLTAETVEAHRVIEMADGDDAKQ